MAGGVSELSLPTGTVTFLLTDVEASTRLWEESPVEMTDSVPRHYAVLDEAIARHGGVRPQEQGEGDSIVAAFARASDAVRGALDAQRSLRTLTPDLRVRMALHAGEAQMRDDNNYVGHAVIRCARLRACAHGGQVLLSDVVAGLVADRLPDGADLVDLGHHRLRDLSRPERVWQLAHPDLPAGFGPLRSLDAFRHNLPAPSTPLVGRAGELAELRPLVLARRFVTVTGAGGVGKTRLAQQVAAELVDQFRDGVSWVELAPVSDPARIASAIAAVVDVAEVPTMSVSESLASHLRNARALLVVDNCEHLVGPVAELLHQLHDECPQLHIVTTSREPLGVPGETAWRTPSMSLPPRVDGARAPRPEAYDAVQLFVERAQQARPNFTLTHENAPTVEQICARLDGIPLAIELAAARVRSLPVDRLAAELDQRFRVLTGGARTAIARQRTLLASVDWSYDLLDDRERSVLRRLSAFTDGFTLDAAEAVCADEQVGAYDVLDVLAQLVDKSLVQFDDELERYRLLETIRVYALDRARAEGDLATSRDRHLAWCLRLAEAWDAEHTIPTRSFVDAIDAEYANLLAALDWSLEAVLAVELLGPLSLVWTARSRFADAIRWTRQILEVVPHDAALRARAVAHLSSAFGAAGGPTFDLEVLTAALEIAEREDDTWAAVRLQMHLATARAALDPSDANIALFDQAIELARDAGDDGGVVQALGIAAVLAAAGGRRSLASSYLGQLEGLDLREYSHAYLVAQGTAMVCLQTGRYREAVDIIEASVDAAPPAPRTGLLFLLGAVGFLIDDVDLVDRALADLPAAEQAGGWDGWICLLRAQRALFDGDIDRAIAGAVDAHRMGAAGTPSSATSISCALTIAEAGGHALAERILDEAAPESDDRGRFISMAPARALIALVREDRALVEQHLFDDLEARRAEGQIPMLAADLEMLACVGDLDRAVRLCAAADRIRQETGHRFRSVVVAERLEAVLAAARQELGERFDSLWEEGAALTWDEAAAYVLRMRGARGRPSHGWSSLTPTELAVADHIAEGLTNPEIAARMLVGVSTVKTHVHHVFTKLGISTRAELAAAVVGHRQQADAAT